MKRHIKQLASTIKNSYSKSKIPFIIMGLVFLLIASFTIIDNTSSNPQDLQGNALANATSSAVTGLCAGRQGGNCKKGQTATASATTKNGLQNALDAILAGITKLLPFLGQNPPIAAPTPVPTATPTGITYTATDVIGKIVHYPADGTIWLIEQDKARYPIPDTATYTCLVGQGYSDAGNVSATELLKYYQSGVLVTCGGNVLKRGHIMFKNTYLKSDNGQYTLWLQADGNVVTYKAFTANATWATFVTADELVQQYDGNLASYKFGQAIGSWNTGTYNTDINNYAVMQNDGNFVVYSSANKALWSSLTGTISTPTPTPTPTPRPATQQAPVNNNVVGGGNGANAGNGNGAAGGNGNGVAGGIVGGVVGGVAGGVAAGVILNGSGGDGNGGNTGGAVGNGNPAGGSTGSSTSDANGGANGGAMGGGSGGPFGGTSSDGSGMSTGGNTGTAGGHNDASGGVDSGQGQSNGGTQGADTSSGGGVDGGLGGMY